MTGGLHRAGFMHVDMTGLGADHALVRTERRSDNGHIGLCSANQEMHRKGIVFTDSADMARSLAAVEIFAIAGSLLHIGSNQLVQYSAVATFAIVIIKVYHR